jgi:hypothetical protein
MSAFNAVLVWVAVCAVVLSFIRGANSEDRK